MVNISGVLPVTSGKRKLRARVTGTIVIVMAFFLLFFFGFNEPTSIQVNEETDIVVCPPFCDEPIFQIPVPDFAPKTIEMTPIISVIDNEGIVTSVRGETTLLQRLVGFDIAEISIGQQFFQDGTLLIDLEFNTLTSDELQAEQQIIASGTIQSIEIRLSDLDVPENSVNLPFGTQGSTTAGIFLANILDTRIDALVPNISGTFNYQFLLLDLSLDVKPVLSQDVPTQFILPTTVVQCVTAPCPPVTNPVLLGEVTFESRLPNFITDPIIRINETEPIPIIQVVEEDTPFLPCPTIKFDSITFLFPTQEISGTTALWDKITIDTIVHDIINVDVRNNRNCDLQIGLGTQWRSVTGQIFTQELALSTIQTNATVPFRSIPFDGRADCSGSCAGLEIQWCFIGQVSETDPTEIVDDFCGKKFFR